MLVSNVEPFNFLYFCFSEKVFFEMSQTIPLVFEHYQDINRFAHLEIDQIYRCANANVGFLNSTEKVIRILGTNEKV